MDSQKEENYYLKTLTDNQEKDLDMMEKEIEKLKEDIEKLKEENEFSLGGMTCDRDAKEEEIDKLMDDKLELDNEIIKLKEENEEWKEVCKDYGENPHEVYKYMSGGISNEEHYEIVEELKSQVDVLSKMNDKKHKFHKNKCNEVKKLKEENKKLKEEDEKCTNCICNMNSVIEKLEEENKKLIFRRKCVSEGLDQMEEYIDKFGEKRIKDMDWEDMDINCLGCRLSRNVTIMDCIIGKLINHNKELMKEKEKVVIAEAC